MISQGLSTFWKLPNMNFLIADVIYPPSDTKISFSQMDATKIKSNQFSEFDSRTDISSPKYTPT